MVTGSGFGHCASTKKAATRDVRIVPRAIENGRAAGVAAEFPEA